MQTEIKFALGKNRGYIPSSLGTRLISVGRQVGLQAVKYKLLFNNFNSVNSKALLSCLNRFRVIIAQ